MSIGEGESHQLDHVLSKTEFETSQQEQAIQSELDKIQAHEKEIEEKQKEIEEFEKVTADVECRKEKVQRQLQLNRDNIESLKHTVTVLDEHLEALRKNHQSAIQKTLNTRAEYDAAIVKYTEKWDRFQNTYQKMPRAQELSKIMETLKQAKAEEANLDVEIMNVQKTIDSLQSEGHAAAVKWVLQIATVRVETEGTLRLLSATRQAVHESKQELDTSTTQLLKLKQGPAVAVAVAAAEEQEVLSMETLPSVLTATPMEVTSETTLPLSAAHHTHVSTTTHTTLCPTKPSNQLILTTHSHDSRAADRAIVPQQQLPNDRSGTLQPPNSDSLQTVPLQPPTQPDVITTPQQGTNPGVFAKPHAPPRRFTLTKPSETSQKQSTAVSSSTAITSLPVNTHSSTTTSSSSIATSSTAAVIPPAFQLMSPRLPVPSSPKPFRASSAEGARKTFELPKFTVPPLSYSRGAAAVVSSATPFQLPPTSSHTASTANKTHGGLDQTGSNYASQRIVPSLSSSSLPSSSLTSSLPSSSSSPSASLSDPKPTTESESVANMMQYQLKMPPKPALPSVHPPSRSSSTSVPTPPPKTFTLPPHLSQLPLNSSSSATQQMEKPPQKRISNTSPQEKPNTHPESSESSAGILNPTSLNVNRAESSSLMPSTEEYHHLHQEQYEDQRQPPATYQHQYYQHQPQQYHNTAYQQQSHQLQEQQQQQETQDEMEVSTHELMEGGREGGGEMEFNPASTSIDFGEQSVDFDNSSQLFALQADDTFNISQTESFFNTNQDTTAQPGGGYSFMQADMNEDSSTTNIQDFFSQFGKTDTSSNTEGAGKFFF